MTATRASAFGKSLPNSIWNSNVLHLPSPLVDAHSAFLNAKGWMDSYHPGPGGGAGGVSSEDAQAHVTNRFLNSAARMQFVCSDPNEEQVAVRDMVLDQLGEGHIFLLDLGAGNGAGTLAMLSLLCELREHKSIPKLPLNVSIHGVDYSPDALAYYADLLSRINPWFLTQGINISLTVARCDLTLSGDFSDVFDSFKSDATSHGVKRFLCVISALSGIGKEGFESIYDSLRIVAAGLGGKDRNSSVLWVEPHVSKAWPTLFADAMRLIFNRVRHRFFKKGESYAIETTVPLMEKFDTRSFEWHDPHITKNTTSHVYVMSFRSE